jgi:hypothetical protein
MAQINPDFSEVQEVKPGQYKARITDSEVRDSKSGTQYVAWTMEIFGEDAGKALGAKVWHNTPISGKGAFRFKELCLAATGDEAVGETELLHGKEVSLIMAEETYNGQSRVAVKAVKRLM